MYGKAFASMYTGSMVGSGAVVFAVWGYVIANMEPDKTVGMQVELNPKYLAGVFGEPSEAITAAIDRLCAPDPDSRSKAQEGRRLVRVGQFAYQVVNGLHYREIRDKEQRREYQRKWQAAKRDSAKPARPSRQMKKMVATSKTGGEATYDRIAREHGYEAADEYQDRQERINELRETAPPYQSNTVPQPAVQTFSVPYTPP